MTGIKADSRNAGNRRKDLVSQVSTIGVLSGDQVVATEEVYETALPWRSDEPFKRLIGVDLTLESGCVIRVTTRVLTDPWLSDAL